MQNTQLDSREFSPLYWPYDLTTPELSDKPRLVSGSLNTFVTSGGKIAKRPGVTDLDATLMTLPANRTVVRLWYYEPPVGGSRWMLASMLKSAGGYEMYYRRVGTGYAWTSFGSTRQMDASETPHECVVQNGVAYVRGEPTAASSEKYSTVSFRADSSAAVKIRWWGLPAPQTPARLSGRTTFLSADIDASTTAINVTANFSPALTAPFTIRIGLEAMTVTSTGAGTNWTVTRPTLGSTASAHTTDERITYFDWTASAHAVNIWSYWRYTYAWVNEFGHISNRAPGETNPDLMQSETGPFWDLCPKVTVQGNADTTNIPTINVYRTQDGGGTFYFVGAVANTGAGDITFEDRLLETGPAYATTQDPIPDNLLDTFNISPDLDSNTAPPTVISPLVIGTDTPEGSTPLASYASRIWYGVRNVLFYSGNEEIAEGIPEESFPAGIDGNFFRFQHNIVSLAASEAALYVFTTEHTYKITGSDLLTLNVAPLYHNIGGYSATSVARMGKNVAFLTHDRRVAVIRENDTLEFISEPCGDSWNYPGAESGEYSFTYWGEKDRDLLFVFFYLPGSSRTFVFDAKLTGTTKEPFWHAPWDVEARAALAAKYDGPNRLLLLAQPTGIRKIGFDTNWMDGTNGYDWIVRSGLQLVPSGNHVNDLRVSGLTPVVVRALIERTKYPADRPPHITFAYDDFWTAEVPAVSTHQPTSHEASKWYDTLIAEADQAAFRVGISLAVHNSVTPVELQTLTTTWAPDSGSMT